MYTQEQYLAKLLELVDRYATKPSTDIYLETERPLTETEVAWLKSQKLPSHGGRRLLYYDKKLMQIRAVLTPTPDSIGFVVHSMTE